MRRTVLAVAAGAALLGAAASSADAADARRSLDEGLAHFAARRYEEAAVKFEEAATKAGSEGLDPAVAHSDRAIALLKAGKAVEAADVLAALLRSPDPRLRESSHYHRGIALTTAADAAERGGEPRKAIAFLEEALTDYESAMRIDPQDEDPKVNHELASRKLAQLVARLQEQEKKGGGPGDRSQAGDAGTGERPPQESERREPEQAGKPARQGSREREMRPDEARTLLDAMRQQELSQRSRTRPFRGEAQSVEKNW